MEELFLAEVSKEHEAEALRYKRDYIEHGEARINGSGGFIRYPDYDAWLASIKQAKCREISECETPATTYFTVRASDGKIVGTIQLRHHLTEELLRDGGSIGYGVCPSERGKGYGVRQLALLLPKARALGLTRVLITCLKSNRASAAVAMRNGGVLGGEGYDEERDAVTEMYWIDLTQA
ncbi:MAG: hypothetical protein ABT01_06420 [Clostridium sp. SCN 57-10]|nr:MAG: hypothetical protein ABT01_06420 [Clostridium sp. SCN 57-10]